MRHTVGACGFNGDKMWVFLLKAIETVADMSPHLSGGQNYIIYLPATEA